MPPWRRAKWEARELARVPEGARWQYEPKWDGRCLLFRDGDQIALQSKACRPLDRYFPDVGGAARGIGASRVVLDGEPGPRSRSACGR